MVVKMKKVTFNLPENVVELMRTWSKERNTTVTEVLKQALRTENFFVEEIDSGHKILIQDENGRMKEVIFQR